MPIVGMTDTQRAAFPRIGVLRKGAPKPKNANQPGKDLEWFRFVTEDEDAMRAFVEACGENPASITVMLPFASTDENFEAWMEEWGAGSLKHRCDGVTCAVWQGEDGEYHHTPIPCPGGCKPTGRLMVIIPDLVRLAYVQVLTTSKHDIMELAANLKAAEETARLMGRDLRGIPFVLTRVPREISTPREKGKRVRVEKWLLHIEPAPSWVAMQIQAAQRMAMPMIEAPTDIPAPNGDDDEDFIEGTAEPVQPKPAEPNGKEADLDAFMERVVTEIPYYNHARHVKNTLKKLGFGGYSKSKESDMFGKLQEYASKKANEKAAGTNPEQDELPLEA